MEKRLQDLIEELEHIEELKMCEVMTEEEYQEDKARVKNEIAYINWKLDMQKEELTVEDTTTRTINGAIKNAKEMTTGERLSNLIKSYVKKPQEGPQEAPKCEKVVYNVDILEGLKNEVKQATKNLGKAIKDYCNNYISYTEYYEFKKVLGSKRGKLAAYEAQCGVWKSRKRI